MEEKYIGGTEEFAIYVTIGECGRCKQSKPGLTMGERNLVHLCFDCMKRISEGDHRNFNMTRGAQGITD